jgi:hypothetical protein
MEQDMQFDKCTPKCKLPLISNQTCDFQNEL